MKTIVKRLLAAAVLAFGLLFFGPAASNAFAWESGPGFAFSGRFVGPHARVFGRGGSFRRFDHRPFFGHRPFFVHRRFFAPRPFFVHRPFRVVRVFVYDPFPHWVFRRVYDPYCDPY